MRLFLILLLSIPIYSETTKVLCELDGDYSVTYKDIKKTYLAEGIELFKNLARQTQQSLFLLRRAKTNFAEEDWQKSSLYVVQYWELNSKEELASQKFTNDQQICAMIAQMKFDKNMPPATIKTWSQMNEQERNLQTEFSQTESRSAKLA